MIVIAAIVAVLLIAAIAAIFVASFASRYEDSVRSLSGSAPGLSARLGRRVLGYHSDPPLVPARQPVGQYSQPRQVRVPAGV